ncbi:MAG: hypothetical protein AB7H96_06850 [Vicinamibacterales bacterium]
MKATAIERITGVIDRFQPPDRRSPEEQLQRRVLTGSALLGIAVATLSALVSAADRVWADVGLVAAFTLSLALLLVAVRRGAPMRVLNATTLTLLSVFFVAASLLTRELQWSQLRWFSLLPLVALFLAEPLPVGGTLTRPVGMLWSATGLAVLLGGLVVVCNRLGLTAGLDAPPPGRSTDLAALVDFALYLVSASGLVGVHHIALRKSEEELELLRSMLSVCAWCRRIRDDEEGWMMLERYMSKHTTTRLTHGICPDCEKRTLDDAAGRG